MRDSQVAVSRDLGIHCSSVHQLFAENIRSIHVFNAYSIPDISLGAENWAVNKSKIFAIMHYMGKWDEDKQTINILNYLKKPINNR